MASIVLAEQQVRRVSGTDGSYDAEDQAYHNQEIISDYLEKGDLKSALQYQKTLRDKGISVDVSYNKVAAKKYSDRIEKAKSERVPELMEQFNLDEKEASEFYDAHESPARYETPPSLRLIEGEPEPEPEKPALPEGMVSALPEGWES